MCTVWVGDWTDWSPWDRCRPACGDVRYSVRSRDCLSMLNGSKVKRECLGSPIEYAKCTEHPCARKSVCFKTQSLWHCCCYSRIRGNILEHLLRRATKSDRVEPRDLCHRLGDCLHHVDIVFLELGGSIMQSNLPENSRNFPERIVKSSAFQKYDFGEVVFHDFIYNAVTLTCCLIYSLCGSILLPNDSLSSQN